MKTLKQIREEYNDKFVTQDEYLPEELMLEKSVLPSTKDMPTLLIFRRVSFRLYPNKQVVALYYSKLVDKYLSIPFGPTGNLNLSEATVADTMDEACWKHYKQVGMKKKGNRTVPNCVPVEEQGSSATRYTERPTYEHFQDKLNEIRMQQNEDWKSTADTVADTVVPYYSAAKKVYKGDYKGAAKDAAVDTALMAVGGPAIRTAAKGLKLGVGAARRGIAKITGKNVIKRDASAIGKSAKTPKSPAAKAPSKIGAAADAISAAGGFASRSHDSGTSTPQNDAIIQRHGDLERDKPTAKVSSSWKSASHEDPVFNKKYRHELVKENKIIDIRKMVNEGVDNKDLTINGRSITLNTSMAKRILEVYDSVNTKNKKIVEGMLNEDLESFKKLLNFSIKA